MMDNSERDERFWNQWTDAEDNLLVELAEKRKTENWDAVATIAARDMGG